MTAVYDIAIDACLVVIALTQDFGLCAYCSQDLVRVPRQLIKIANSVPVHKMTRSWAYSNRLLLT